MMSRNSSSTDSRNYMRTSFAARQAELTRRRLWPAALSAVFFLLYYPVAGILIIARGENNAVRYGLGAARARQNILHTLDALGGIGGISWIAVVGLAVLLGLTGYAWLDSRVQIDFYESQPVSRSVRFFDVFINCLLIMLLPGALSLGLYFTAVAAMGYLETALLYSALYAFARLILLFLAVLAVTVLSVMLSGNLVVAFILTLIFLLYEIAACLIMSSYGPMFFATWSEERGVLSLKLPPLANHLSYLMLDKEVYPSYFRGIYSSPVQNLRDAANTLFVRDLCTFAVFAAVLMTAWGLYRYRKNEHAGMSVISPAVRVILKVMVSVLGALLCGLILSELFEYGRSGGKTLTVIMVCGILFGAAAAGLVTESVYQQNFRGMFRNAWTLALSGILSVLIFAAYKNDVFGYDRYIPAADQVESAAVIAYPEIDGSYYDGSGRDVSYDEFVRDNMFLEDIGAVIELAESAMPYTVSLKEEISSGMYYPDNSRRITVLYRMKDGRVKQRSVSVPEDIDEKIMNRILGSDEYRMNMSMAGHEDTILENTSPGWMSFEVGYGAASGDEADYEDFIEAYRNDLRSYDYTLASGGDVAGYFTVERRLNASSGSVFLSYPVYAEYGESLQFLKDHGLYLPPKLSAENIETVVITNSHYDELREREMAAAFDEPGADLMTVKTAEYREPEKIAAVLEACAFDTRRCPWDAREFDRNYDVMLEVAEGTELYRNSRSDWEKSSYGYREYGTQTIYVSLISGKVPEFVKEDTALDS